MAEFVESAIGVRPFDEVLAEPGRVVRDGGPCFRPDFNGYGATIHAAPCNGASQHWNFYMQTQEDSRATGWYIITWSVPGFSACLVPNWDRAGSPLVLADNCDTLSGGHSFEWYFWPEPNGDFELVNNGNTSLVMDMDISAGNYGRLQERTANYWDNQKFFVTGGHT